MQLKLVSKKVEVPNVISFIFEGDLTFKPGQFMRYHLEDPKPDERSFNRFFTIASAPHERHIQLTTRFVPDNGSSFKKDLRHLQIGERIEASGPSGEFVVEDPNLNYVFIAGGIGITPFRSIVKDLDHRGLPINITLLYANRNSEIIFKEELEEIAAKNPNFKIHYFIEPERIDEAAIRSVVADLSVPIFYVSGPEPMVEAFEKVLFEMGVLDEHIKRDYFPGYKEI